MRRTLLVVVVAALGAGAPRAAQAFCGFYVAGAEDDLFNNATTVALMRDGRRTVLSMQNNYQGPPQDFAMVVPVPVVLQKKNVKTLPAAIFDRLDKLAAPRLVEYWEQDPCPPDAGPLPPPSTFGTIGSAGTGSAYGGWASAEPRVVVEAQFTVGEYEIVILSAEEATALERWLTGNGYKIPAGAAAHLQPYVAGGMKFFVAKVDIDKVAMKDGMATLSPLRFHYDTDEFSLPIRLGLINSAGTQDLLVHIVAPGTRYEVANYDNVLIPTNLVVQNEVRDRFGEFYAALFDATLEKNPGAVVTEYAWSAGSCDPCPESPLSDSELATLGLDVLYDEDGQAEAREPVFRPGVPTIKGDMNKDVLRRFVRRHYNRLRQCPARGERGKLVATFDIDDAGTLSNVEVTGTGGEAFRECVATALGTIRVPKNMSSKVTYPLPYRTRAVSNRRAAGFVLTRLHARYAKDAIGDDLVFKKAGTINGGTGGAIPDKAGLLSAGGAGMGTIGPSGVRRGPSLSTFQGRYIIRHEWTGAMTCANPRRGVWGGPPPGVQGDMSPKAAQDLAFARRGGVSLTSMLAQPPPPEIAVDKGEPVGEDTDDKPPKAEPPETEKKSGGSCSCRAVGAADGAAWIVVLCLLVRRRRGS